MHVGARFSSYEQFLSAFNEYKKQNNVEFYVSDSRTLEAARKRYPNKVEKAPMSLKFYFVKMQCIHGGAFKKRGSGQRETW